MIYLMCAPEHVFTLALVFVCPRAIVAEDGCTELGVTECTIDDLFSSDDGCVTLDVTGRRGERTASLSLAVVALKTGEVLTCLTRFRHRMPSCGL
jgi:hypothetical protein